MSEWPGAEAVLEGDRLRKGPGVLDAARHAKGVCPSGKGTLRNEKG